MVISIHSRKACQISVVQNFRPLTAFMNVWALVAINSSKEISESALVMTTSSASDIVAHPHCPHCASMALCKHNDPVSLSFLGGAFLWPRVCRHKNVSPVCVSACEDEEIVAGVCVQVLLLPITALWVGGCSTGTAVTHLGPRC